MVRANGSHSPGLRYLESYLSSLGGVISFVVPVLFGTIVRPVPAEGIVGICGFIGLGVLGCVLALMRNRTDAKTTYAVTDRRLLCAVGDQRKAIREVVLTHLEGPRFC
jgi:hypothetical protein